MELIRANGIETAVVRRGSGPPLLLLHGFEADHAMFDQVAERLSENFTVYAYDQRDCGRTSNGNAAYTITDLADDAAALVAALGHDKAIIYGSSLGGLIAQALAATHPGRIACLVLGNTWRNDRKPVDVNPAGVAELEALRINPAGNVGRIVRYFFPEEYIRRNPSVLEMFSGKNARPAEDRARRRAAVSQATAFDLSSFQRPTLVLTGSEDRLIPPTASLDLRELIPHAEVAVLDGVGHVGVIQAPGQVASMLTTFALDKVKYGGT